MVYTKGTINWRGSDLTTAFFNALQIIHDTSTVDFVVEEEAQDGAMTWLDVEVHRPFNVENSPPFRVRLLKDRGGYAEARVKFEACCECVARG